MKTMPKRRFAAKGALLAGAVSWGIALGGAAAYAAGQKSPARHINSERLQGTLEKLGEFGRDPGGGITRLGFSQAELDARAYVMDLMKQAGLEVRVDPAGNIFGRRAGTEKLPLLLFGSHIDSVPHGGAFDGSVGSLGAIEVVRALNDGHIKTRHPLEVVVWTDEEGPHFGVSALGSGVAGGSLGPVREDGNRGGGCNSMCRDQRHRARAQ
jgi:N-carbamoyl-L-amino-acid hydrolase